jgi:hypothetical protein
MNLSWRQEETKSWGHDPRRWKSRVVIPVRWEEEKLRNVVTSAECQCQKKSGRKRWDSWKEKKLMHIQFSEESWELRIASSSLEVEGEQRRSGLEHQRNIRGKGGSWENRTVICREEINIIWEAAEGFKDAGTSQLKS